jgi:vancomycin permeability regulator SanA
MKLHTVLVGILMLTSCAFGPGRTRHMLSISEKENFDAIIVPGVPFKEGKWNPVMKSRVYWSKYLYDKEIAKNIIYSGSAVYTPYIEAEIMALYAEKIGIDKKNIFVDTLAQHSTENVYYSWRLAKQLGFNKIAIASDPFQTRMLKGFLRKRLNNEITLIPFVIDTLRAMEPLMTDPEIDYQKAYRQDFVSILKRENFSQRFRGTLGLRIDTSVYKRR